MYIVTGLGRCGTSILTKYLGQSYYLGYNINWQKEARAGLELSPFYSLIHDLYHLFCKDENSIELDTKCMGDYWKDFTYGEALATFHKDERQMKDKGIVEVVKDPRITWHPDLIEAIWKARNGDFKLIICNRKFEEIKKSREIMSTRYQDPKGRKTEDDYRIDFENFMERVQSLNIPYLYLFYPDFLLNAEETFKKLFDFGLTKLENNLNELVDEDLICKNIQH